MGNANLNRAKDLKNDEFYTRYEDIDTELYYYTTDRADLKIRNQFKDKIVFCNCDDPEWSNFWQYFDRGFNRIGLKKLISTHYESSGLPSYVLIKERVYDNIECKTIKLKGNGDFRSEECLDFLKECDIVCTNPPFSLFREYLALLIEYNKQFIIIGNMNACHYKEVFPLIKENKIWLGYNDSNGVMIFRTPNDTFESKPTYWYTNMECTYRNEDMNICDYYYGNESKYPKYDNFDGINVDKLDDIPCDYEGYMGVPDGILRRYNPKQVELIGIGSGNSAKQIGVTKNYRGRTDIAYTTEGGIHKCPYSRIIIRNRNPKGRK